MSRITASTPPGSSRSLFIASVADPAAPLIQQPDLVHLNVCAQAAYHAPNRPSADERSCGFDERGGFLSHHALCFNYSGRTAAPHFLHSQSDYRLCFHTKEHRLQSQFNAGPNHHRLQTSKAEHHCGARLQSKEGSLRSRVTLDIPESVRTPDRNGGSPGD
jgi:hypothetical protein